MLKQKSSAFMAAVAGLVTIMGLASGATLFDDQYPPDQVDRSPTQPRDLVPALVVYTIECHVSQNGEEPERAPKVTCEAGHPVQLFAGHGVSDPRGGTVLVGFTCSTTITPAKDGNVWVDIRAEQSILEPTEGNGVRLRGETLQLIKVVKLGEKVDLEIPSAKGKSQARPTRFDLAISTAKSSTKASSKCGLTQNASRPTVDDGLKVIPQASFIARVVDGKGKPTPARLYYEVVGQFGGETWRGKFRQVKNRPDMMTRLDTDRAGRCVYR